MSVANTRRDARNENAHNTKATPHDLGVFVELVKPSFGLLPRPRRRWWWYLGTPSWVWEVGSARSCLWAAQQEEEVER